MNRPFSQQTVWRIIGEKEKGWLQWKLESILRRLVWSHRKKLSCFYAPSGKKTLWQGENITGGLIIAFHWAEPVPRLFEYFTMLDLPAWHTGAVDGTVSQRLCLLRHVEMSRAEKSSIVHSGLQSVFHSPVFYVHKRRKKNLSGEILKFKYHRKSVCGEAEKFE